MSRYPKSILIACFVTVLTLNVSGRVYYVGVEGDDAAAWIRPMAVSYAPVNHFKGVRLYYWRATISGAALRAPLRTRTVTALNHFRIKREGTKTMIQAIIPREAGR